MASGNIESNPQSMICVKSTDENSKCNGDINSCDKADSGSSQNQIISANECSQEKQDIAKETSQGDHTITKPLYVENDNIPSFYKVKSDIVTPTLLTKNLPHQFDSLPIHGYPKNNSEIAKFYKDKLRKFVGFDLNDEEFDNLSQYCSPQNLKMGEELQMSANFPNSGSYPAIDKVKEKQKEKNKKGIDEAPRISDKTNLFIHKKLEYRIDNDISGTFVKRLKYRGIRFLPFPTVDDVSSASGNSKVRDLEPGKDILYRVRMYRSYTQTHRGGRPGAQVRTVFTCDAVLLGRQPLNVLRERFVCPNDVGLRLDHSQNPEDLPNTNAKTLFPSGFLFINNVFYVDMRDGCADHSEIIRSWAARRGMGTFPCRDMCATLMQDVPLKLGHPEVYVHQGNCEHLFTFSEARLLGAREPPLRAQYPLHRAHAQHHTLYCTTCAEFCAKWIVAGCARVPFDPAFFCDTCLKLYLYVDGNKVGDFKAYSFKGNELNTFKPQR